MAALHGVLNVCNDAVDQQHGTLLGDELNDIFLLMVMPPGCEGNNGDNDQRYQADYFYFKRVIYHVDLSPD
jgi:hypothetical protein